MQQKQKVGVIGAGTIGSVLIRRWAEAGYPITVGARHARRLAALVQALSPEHRVIVGSVSDAIAYADILVLAIPFQDLDDIFSLMTEAQPQWVLDVTSPYSWDQNGQFQRLLPTWLSGGEVVAQQLPDYPVVKAFSNLPPKVIEIQANQEPERLAVPYATDEPSIQPSVDAFITGAGFDPVFIGSLKASQQIEHFGTLFNKILTASELREELK